MYMREFERVTVWLNRAHSTIALVVYVRKQNVDSLINGDNDDDGDVENNKNDIRISLDVRLVPIRSARKLYCTNDCFRSKHLPTWHKCTRKPSDTGCFTQTIENVMNYCNGFTLETHTHALCGRHSSWS